MRKGHKHGATFYFWPVSTEDNLSFNCSLVYLYLQSCGGRVTAEGEPEKLRSLPCLCIPRNGKEF